ncbi:MAG: helix-turn-helix domain-containing protein [Synergistaceae bacterium]|nr:helix-turn-helix domain-containing protein [Synergistaceae bacterium]
MDNLNGDYLTTPEASEISHKCESFIKRLCRDGRLLGAKKLGKTWLIPRTSIESYTPGKRGRRAKKETLAAELESIRAEISASKEKI